MSSEQAELRQRKGASSSTTAADEDSQAQERPEDMKQRFSETIHSILAERVVKQGRAVTKEEIDRCVAEDLEKIAKQQDGPLPGIKDATKKAKDELTADPYNLEKIANLGQEYCKEEKHKEAMNVMARGWKRVAAPKGKSEVDDERMQFEYLFQFCECSVACHKYLQADHIMRDVEKFCMPQESEELRMYYIMDCKIQAQNDKFPPALQAFKNALNQCENFDDKAKVWAHTIASLKKVGAGAVAKEVMERTAESDEHKRKLSAIDSMNELKESIDSVKPSGTVNYLLLAAAVFLFSIIVYMLWWLEQRSLEGLKLKPVL